MKHKTWFRLVLKVVGIYLVAHSMPGILNVAAATITISLGIGPWGRGFGSSIDGIVGAAVQWGLVGDLLRSIIGFYLLLGGGLIVNLVIPSNRPYCPDCGHELRGVAGVHCPECGSRIPADLLPATESPEVEQPAAPPVSPARTYRFIPVENRKALLGYYFAVASLIPLVGLVLGPIAFAHGVEGIRYATRNAPHRGLVHGWVAVVLGALTTAANGCGLCLVPWMIVDNMY